MTDIEQLTKEVAELKAEIQTNTQNITELIQFVTDMYDVDEIVVEYDGKPH